MMSEIEYHKEIYNVLKASKNPIINASYLEVDNQIEVKLKADELAIEIEEIQGRIRLLTKSISVIIFESVDSFLSAKEINSSSNILICNNEKPVSYICGKVFEDFKDSQNFLVKNIISILLVLVELRLIKLLLILKEKIWTRY